VQFLNFARAPGQENYMFKKLNAVKAAVVTGALALGSAANAALPTGAQAAIEGVGTDVVQAVGYVILAGIAIYAAKKLGQKMGWL
jgi:hypothetical protein